MKEGSFYFPKLEAVAAILFIAAFFAVPVSTTVGEICIFSSLLMVLLSGNWSHRFSLVKSNYLIYVIWGFALLIIVGCFYSYSTMHIAIHTAKSYLWLLLLPLFLISIPYAMLEKYAVNTFLVTLSIVLLLSYALYFSVDVGANYFGWERPHSGVNVFKDHIVQTMLFSLAFLVSLYRATNHDRKRILYVLLSLGFLFNVIFLSEGRSGYLMVCIIIMFVFCYKCGIRKLIYPVVGLALLLGAAYMFSNSFHVRVKAGVGNIISYQQKVKGAENTSMGIRLNEWKSGIYMISLKPIFGYGTGGIAYAGKKYAELNGLPVSNYHDPRTDSTYLNVLCQYGLFGFLFLIFFMYSIWKSSDNLQDEYKLIIRAIIFSYAILFVFNCWLSEVTASEMLMLFMTLCFSRAVQCGLLIRDKQDLSCQVSGAACSDS